MLYNRFTYSYQISGHSLKHLLNNISSLFTVLVGVSKQQAQTVTDQPSFFFFYIFASACPITSLVLSFVRVSFTTIYAQTTSQLICARHVTLEVNNSRVEAEMKLSMTFVCGQDIL